MGHSPAGVLFSGQRILVVEDNFVIAAGIVEAIREAGARVIGPYASMVDALEHLTDLEAIDGAVLDIGLNEEESYPLAEALQITRIPFMFLTGVPKDQLPEQFSRVTHMLKPFSTQNLIRTLFDTVTG